MLLNDEMVNHYAKKVMGFAFSKTKDSYLAEDLAQEIMFQLATSLSKNPNIKQLDSYVYTLCCYTWSKYLRGNKKHWDNYNLHAIPSIAADTNVEQETISTMLVEKMNQEIARKLGVAAAYIEKHVENLTYMDYLKQVGNKYQTNFFIEEPRHIFVKARYQYENIGPFAEQLFEILNERLENIVKIGFLGADLDKNILMWTFLSIFGHQLSKISLGKIPGLAGLEAPKRKDGSTHWVNAGIKTDNYEKTQTEFSQSIIDFANRSNGNGFKYSVSELCSGIQAETWLSIKHEFYWREFTDPTLNQLTRIKEIIQTNAVPNENDKLIIAGMVKEGYVTTDGGHISLLIPFLTADQDKAIKSILQEITTELGEEFWLPYFLKFSEVFEKEIPTFLDEDIRIYSKHSIYPAYAIIAWIVKKGWLRLPTKEEAKAVCTILTDKS